MHALVTLSLLMNPDLSSQAELVVERREISDKKDKQRKLQILINSVKRYEDEYEQTTAQLAMETENADLRKRIAGIEEEMVRMQAATKKEVAQMQTWIEEEVARMQTRLGEELARMQAEKDEEVARMQAETELDECGRVSVDGTPTIDSLRFASVSMEQKLDAALRAGVSKDAHSVSHFFSRVKELNKLVTEIAEIPVEQAHSDDDIRADSHRRALEEQRRGSENLLQSIEAEKRDLLEKIREMQNREKLFEESDEARKRELENIRVALEDKRRGLFEEYMEAVRKRTAACEPWWTLPAEELQQYLLTQAPKSQTKLRALIDLMGDVAGFTVLDKWVEVGGLHKNRPNFGKITSQLIASTVNESKGNIASAQLNVASAQLTNLLNAETIAYHHAILLSCERRSALTDFIWEKKIGEGGFGVAHLCRNRFSGEQRVIKFIMPDGGEQGMRRDVKETELHMKVAVSDFIAKIITWGTFDTGACQCSFL